MSRDLSATLTEELLSQEMSEVIVTLLELDHPDFDEVIYLCDNPTETLMDGEYGTTSNSIEYTFLPFQLIEPPQDEDILGRGVLKLDNITRDLIAAVLEVQGDPITVNIKFVLASAPDSIEYQYPAMRMENIRANAFELEADLFPNVLQGEQFPYDSFNNANFPGLYSGF